MLEVHLGCIFSSIYGFLFNVLIGKKSVLQKFKKDPVCPTVDSLETVASSIEEGF